MLYFLWAQAIMSSTTSSQFRFTTEGFELRIHSHQCDLTYCFLLSCLLLLRTTYHCLFPPSNYPSILSGAQNVTILAFVMQLTLKEILAKHDWISTFTHPPDVASLLRTNEGPSPLQSAGLKTSLERLTAALAELQSDLVLLHNVAASVEAPVSRLQSLEKDYETILSPMRRIPSEIAMEILRRARKGNEFGDTSERRLSGFDVFTIREGPWHLGQVCSSWRNVIETLCPELWATMAVEMPFSYQHLTADTAVEILSVTLERSRNHPLDFYFHYDEFFSEVEEMKPQTMEQCFDIMVGHSKRWRVVEMTLNPSLLPRLSRPRKD
ncbi:hypothetical protein ARMGADRAFT_827976 [Armillaria gallica]|uniref:F-box domain-containing protein n=1 Tax=Armillaria gallica TaxID=47427 RepID=A0A2H3CN77_ARMGA|nr:hypothetical protein ARMGADRAFT_827976 [Armillaria gallica]